MTYLDRLRRVARDLELLGGKLTATFPAAETGYITTTEAGQWCVTMSRDVANCITAISKAEGTANAESEGYWWCESCQAEKSPYQVTYEENCTRCGQPVQWRLLKAEGGAA